MELFTDWTRTEPVYFYLRGTLLGFVIGVFVALFVASYLDDRKNKK